MKKQSDREELLTDILAEESQLRFTTLELGLAEMRRVHRRRRAVRICTAVCTPVFMLAAAVFVRDFQARRTSVAPVVQVEEMIPGTSFRVMSDEQLLTLFKGRPVALVGPAGHQRLLLLDEAAN